MFDSLKSLGTTLFYQPLFNLLFGFVALLPGESLGYGIIALTVFIRLLLMPSTAASVRSQREMMALQPKIDEIRAKYGDKPEELNKRLLAVYQEHKVNPFGSCLPLLIQLPVLWVLYRVFFTGIHPQNFDLLYSFVPAPESLNTMFLGVDLQNPSLAFALIAGALQFGQTWQLMRQRQQEKDRRQLPKNEKLSAQDEATRAAEQMSSRMMYFMPLLTVFITATLPAALGLYWIVTTVFSIGQQWYLIRRQPALPHHHAKDGVTVQIRPSGSGTTEAAEPKPKSKRRKRKRSR